MAADLQLIFSETFVNKASGQVFPQIASALSGSDTIPDQNLTLQWAVTAPPSFQLDGKQGAQTFSLVLQIQISVTPQGQPTDSGTAQGLATVQASVDGTGTLRLRVAAIGFAGVDPFLTAVLNQKQADIADKVNGFLATIAPKLSIVNGITFVSYAIQFGNGAGGMAASLQQGASVDNLVPPASSDFSMSLSQPLVNQVVLQNWWNGVTKQYSASGATVNLNSYSLILVNGTIQLSLFMGGHYSQMGGDWDVDIDPVLVSLGVTIDGSNNVKPSYSDVSTPNVSLNPSNWLAWIYTIGAAVITGIANAIIADVIGDRIKGSIQSNLDQPFLQLPNLSGSYDGVAVALTLSNLTVGGVGAQLTITGNGTATATPGQG